MIDLLLALGATGLALLTAYAAGLAERRVVLEGRSVVPFRATWVIVALGLFLVFWVDPFHAHACGGGESKGGSGDTFDHDGLFLSVAIACGLLGFLSGVTSLLAPAREGHGRPLWFRASCALLAAGTVLSAALAFGNPICP